MKKKLEDKCIDLQAMEMAIFRSHFNLFDINHNARVIIWYLMKFFAELL